MVNHIICVSFFLSSKTFIQQVVYNFNISVLNCLVELIQSHPQMFSDGQQRRLSDASMQSTVSGLIDNIPLTTITTCEWA